MNETNEKAQGLFDANMNRRVWHALVCLVLFCAEIFLYASTADYFSIYLLPAIASEAFWLLPSHYLADIVVCVGLLVVAVALSCWRHRLRKRVDIEPDSLFDTMENVLAVPTIVFFLCVHSFSFFTVLFGFAILVLVFILTIRLPEETPRPRLCLYTHIFAALLYIIAAALFGREVSWLTEVVCIEMLVYLAWRLCYLPLPDMPECLRDNRRDVCPRVAACTRRFTLPRDRKSKTRRFWHGESFVILHDEQQDECEVACIDRVKFQGEDYAFLLPATVTKSIPDALMILHIEKPEKDDDQWRLTEVQTQELYMELYGIFKKRNRDSFRFEEEWEAFRRDMYGDEATADGKADSDARAQATDADTETATAG